VSRACDGVNLVYHLAAAQHEASVPDQHFYEVNVEGTRNLLEASASLGVRRFVHGSTIGVYGSGGAGEVGDDSPLCPDNIYGVTKLEAERVAQGYSQRIPVAIARISETYGPGDRRLLKLFRAIGSGRFVRIGPGRNLHHLVYIDDLIQGLRLAAGSRPPVSEPFVLAGPEAIASDEMISVVARVLGRDPPKLRIPLWPLMGVAVGLEGVLRPMGIQPPLHRRRMNFFVKSFSFDMQPVRETLGYHPTVRFEEGAAKTAAWYRSRGLLSNLDD
jgi:nucleoside-diphosphate-sugar epimerase